MRGVRRCDGRLISGAIACCVAAAGFWAEARAEDREHPEDAWGQTEITPSASHFELWAGSQAFKHAWSLYTGVTVAPLAAIEQDGLRLRMVGGYGAYSYAGLRAVGVDQQTVNFKGTVAFTDALVGYHKQLGPLTVKVFAGLTAAQYRVEPDDPETSIRGPGFGGKVALETWWNIGDRAWSSVDVSWGSLHDSYAARARLGWRLLPALSAGLEAGGAGNQESDSVRVGGFLRYEWESGEFSASGGLSNDKLWQGVDRASVTQSSAPFATLTWLARF
jgi:hypothetical protein